MKIILGVVICHLGLSGVAWADDWKVTYPPRFLGADLASYVRRLCFGVDDANLESVIGMGRM